MRATLVAACVAALACGRTSTSPVERRDASVPDASVVVEVPAASLGADRIEAFAWRKRPGHAVFREALDAEAANGGAGDWATVVAACERALRADPTHLEAAWLLAVGRAKTGKLDQILVPLQRAAAGDFAKWGPASLELPSLQPFLATPTGQAWRRRVEQDRTAYVAALARSVIVSSEGDLYAHDLSNARWYRQTRTFGSVIAAYHVPGAPRFVYVTRRRAKDKPVLAVGTLDLARGRATRAQDLGPGNAIAIAYATKPVSGAWIGIGLPRPTSWHRLDDEGKLTTIGKSRRPPGPWLEVKGTRARLHALPIAQIAADWDQHGLASAIRIGKSNRVVYEPIAGLIDGNTVSWSPGRTHLAFVAQLDDRCLPSAVNAAVFVADAATGTLQELQRAADGLAVEWVTDRKLAIAGDAGVSIVDLDGTPPVVLPGADGLVTPRQRPRCTPLEPDELPPEIPADVPIGEDVEPRDPVVGPIDAGGVDARRSGNGSPPP